MKPPSATLPLGQRTLIMGVVNVTPDSFSDGGDFAAAPAAVARAKQLASQGADIIDIGGESTRPGSAGVPEEDELQRVVPVADGLSKLRGAALSIDTSKSAVARACLERGFTVVNDVTAGRHDPKIFREAAEFGAYLVLMHMQGDPRTMQEAPKYTNVVGEVAAFLKDRAELAVAAGVARDKILVDPGIGFGKTLEHNLELLRAIPRLKTLGYPLVVGVSRKSLIATLIGQTDPKDRDRATADLSAVLAFMGADVLRVHEVPQNLEATRLGDAVRRGRGPVTTKA